MILAVEQCRNSIHSVHSNKDSCKASKHNAIVEQSNAMGWVTGAMSRVTTETYDVPPIGFRDTKLTGRGRSESSVNSDGPGNSRESHKQLINWFRCHTARLHSASLSIFISHSQIVSFLIQSTWTSCPLEWLTLKTQRISEVAGEGDGAIREHNKNCSPPSEHKKCLQVVRHLLNTFIKLPKVVHRWLTLRTHFLAAYTWKATESISVNN